MQAVPKSCLTNSHATETQPSESYLTKRHQTKRHQPTRHQTKGNPSKRHRGRLLVGFASLIGCLGIGEAALVLADLPRPSGEFRFVGPDLGVGEVFADFDATYVSDHELFWRLDRERTGYVTNEIGLRGFWPAGPRADGGLRIACVGDSCTFGHGVRYEDTFGVRLERALQARMPAVVVDSVLAALPGYSTQQSRVLFDRHVAPLAPDVTVFYCGAWNDYMPAVGVSDAARHARATGGMRLWRLLSGLGERRVNEDFMLAIRSGAAPDGRRVPLAQFRKNLAHLITAARGCGSRVIMIEPPLPPDTAARFPIGLEYRAVLRDVAAAHSVHLVDVMTAFRTQRPPGGEGACFRDWIHLSALGHELVANELLPLVAPDGGRERAVAAAEVPAVRSVEPTAIPALGCCELAIGGVGFGAASIERVWIGGIWMPRHRIVDSARLAVVVDRALPPGEHRIELGGSFGLVSSAVLLRVVAPRAPQLRASVQGQGGEYTLELACAAPLGCAVAVWFAEELLPVPRATAFGAFELAGVAEDLQFEGIQLPRILGHASRHPGGFALRRQIDRSMIPVDRGLFVQGLIADRFDPTNAVVTSVARLTMVR